MRSAGFKAIGTETERDEGGERLRRRETETETNKTETNRDRERQRERAAKGIERRRRSMITGRRTQNRKLNRDWWGLWCWESRFSQWESRFHAMGIEIESQKRWDWEMNFNIFFLLAKCKEMNFSIWNQNLFVLGNPIILPPKYIFPCYNTDLCSRLKRNIY